VTIVISVLLLTAFYSVLNCEFLNKYIDIFYFSSRQERPHDFGQGVNAPLPPEAKKSLII